MKAALDSARFGERPSPQLNFITHDTEAMLLAEIEAALKDIPAISFPGHSGRSRVRRYGWGYDAKQEWIEEIPIWVLALAPRLAQFNSVTLNQYNVGDLIPPHIDSLDFGPVIQILSLKSAATMDFKRKCCAMPFALLLPPRSLLTLDGDYRVNWFHSVRPRDELQG